MTAARDDRRVPVRLVVLVVLGVLVLLATAVVVLDLARGEETPEPGAGAQRSIEVPPAPAGTPKIGSYVDSRIGADGQVSVRQWIRSSVPIQRLELTTADPDALPGTVEAARVLLSASDGSRLAFRASVGTQTQRIRLREPATEVYLSYTIGGDTVSTETATVEGRILARVTGMDVVFEGEDGPTVRLVRGTGPVLNAACLAADAGFDAVPVPCGAAATDGAWQVELRGVRRHDRVIAQLET